MKNTKRQQREKDELNVKTKSPHSIASPSTTSLKLSSSAAASNVTKIIKKSHIIQKRTADKPSSVQTKLMSVKNENGTKSVIVSKVRPKTATSTPAVAAAAPAHEVNKDRTDKRVVRGDSKYVATQVEPKVSVESPTKIVKL